MAFVLTTPTSAGRTDYLHLDGTTTMAGVVDTDVGTFTSNVADGASAVGFSFDTANSITTDTSRTFEITNNGADVIAHEYISGLPYLKIPDRMILGEATGNPDRLIDAKITFDAPAIAPTASLLFEADVVTSNVLPQPIAIHGIARISASGFGAIPSVFKAEIINDQNVNSLYGSTCVNASLTNNSSSVGAVHFTAFGNSGTSVPTTKLPDHIISLGHPQIGIGAQVGVEAELNSSISAVISSNNEYADHCYSVMSFGGNENNAIGFGGTTTWSIGTTPSPETLESKIYYDSSSLMLLSSLNSQGNVGVAGNLSIGDDTALGQEEVINGDFALGTDWTLGTGWSIVGGQLTHTGTAGDASQDISGMVEGRMYKFEYTIAGNNFTIATGNCPTITIGGTIFPRKFRAGTYTHYFVATGSNILTISALAFHVYQLDDISINETQGGDLYVSGDTSLGNGTSSKVGIFGVTPVVQPTALTATDANTPNSGDPTTDAIIANLQTRVDELETKLQALGVIA